MSPSSTVHDSKYDTKYVTLEYLLNAAFVVDTIWGDNLELARVRFSKGNNAITSNRCN